MSFSRRTAWSREANAFALCPPGAIDLTISNPSAMGFEPPAEILAQLADPRAAHYLPDPLGLASARDAVGAYYARRGVRCTRDDLLLTASTSEAYHTLFCLLADPGEHIIVPSPSYPLFSYLGDLAGVQLDAYPLVYAGEWHVDVPALAAAIGPRTRAIVLVSPNNPTASCVRPDEYAAIVALAARHDLALIQDEVFADACWRDEAPSFLRTESCLAFALSGLSKVAALPQLKLGWMQVMGEGKDEALCRLALIADSFLSVNGPVQHALPAILLYAETLPLRQRLRAHLQALDAACQGSAATRLHGDGGFSAVLKLPAVHSEEEWLARCATHGLHVQPGHFFDLGPAPHLVVSLLAPHFQAAMLRLRALLHAR